MSKAFKVLGIMAVLLLATITAILGIMASEGKSEPPIVEVEPIVLVEPVNEFSPLIDVMLDPSIEVTATIGGDGPRYDEETVMAIMRDYDYPWLPIKPLVIEHHSGRIWYIYATFKFSYNEITRLYIFDEPL